MRRTDSVSATAMLAVLVCSGVLAQTSATHSADDYPNKPVRFIVPTASGGSPDIAARILGNKLTEQLKQQFIVDIRAGASGVIAAEIAKTATPDGYTLFVATTTTFASIPVLKKNLPYDPEKDFIALSRIAWVSNVVVVYQELGVDSVADLVKLAKAKPGQLNYGSAGIGSPAHLAGAMFDVLAGVKTVHVPYKGAAPALNDVMAGRVQFLITSPVVVAPHAKSGRIKVLATTGASRDPLLPELPTVAETVPGYDITQWWGVAAPIKTPPAIVKRLHAEIVKALDSPEVRDLLARQGATAKPESPEEFAAFVKAERGRIADIRDKAGIPLED